MKWQNIIIPDPVVSECFLHFLGFGKGQTECHRRGHHNVIIGHWKKLDRQQADGPALSSKIKPASFAILQQICNSTGWSVKLTWQLMFLASIGFFVVLDAAVQTQHIKNHLVKIPVKSSLVVYGYFHLFRHNGSQHWWKCLWKGNALWLRSILGQNRPQSEGRCCWLEQFRHVMQVESTMNTTIKSESDSKSQSSC